MSGSNDKLKTRKRVFLPATIEFNDGNSVFSCMLRDLTNKGARLSIASTIGVPERFTLLAPARQLHEHCRVVWREEHEIGVSFEV